MSNYEVEINLSTSDFIHYSHYLNGISAINRLYIKNKGDEDIENATINISSSPSFLVAQKIEQPLIPRKKTVSFNQKINISPLFFANLNDNITAEIIVDITVLGEVIARDSCTVNLLGYDEANLTSNFEYLSGFVKNSVEVGETYKMALKYLAMWKKRFTDAGYAKNDKNEVRFFLASIYSALLEVSFIKQGDSQTISTHKQMFEVKCCSPLELALYVASVLESKAVNPILVKYNEHWYVGAHLQDNIFSDIITEDLSALSKKFAIGVNEVSMLCVDDLFTNISFEASECKARTELKEQEKFDFALDIKKARLAGINALPERKKTNTGYDLIEDKIFRTDLAPKKIVEFKGSLELPENTTKEKQWERRLLDLSMKNSLLNFTVSQTSLHLLSSTIEDFIEGIQTIDYTLLALPKENENLAETEEFGKDLNLLPIKDLLRLEYKNAKIRALVKEKDLDKTTKNIFRKERMFIEESGAGSLYLAVGFLKWFDKLNVNKMYYAPLVLYPVVMDLKAGSTEKFTIRINEDDEIRINNSLLEFLFQEFNIDMRGLGTIKLEDNTIISSILARMRKEIVDLKGWEIVEDVYLSSFSFTSYLMWKDVREKIDIFRKHPIIANLIDGANASVKDKTMAMHNGDEVFTTNNIYLPISADSSQFSAVVDSLSKSFVLHGPPGTGKSQTITNIIANNIVNGKKVLFVAEKMAALEVVKRRLDSIGIGDFCLELYSNKSNKEEIVTKILDTMNIPCRQNDVDFEQKKLEIKDLLAEIEESVEELHKKRYLGFSIYDAIVRYLNSEDALDCIRIDAIFYERLTEESLARYEKLLTELSSCVKECGDISQSPFRKIGYFEYSQNWRYRAENSIAIYMAEIEHLQQMAKSVLSLLNVRTTSLSLKKLSALNVICNGLTGIKQEVANYFINSKNYVDIYATLENYTKIKDVYQTQLNGFRQSFNDVPEMDVKLFNDCEGIAKERFTQKIYKKLERCAITEIDRDRKDEYVKQLERLTATKEQYLLRKNEAEKLFKIAESVVSDVDANIEIVNALYAAATEVYVDLSHTLFDKIAYFIIFNKPVQILQAYTNAYKGFVDSKEIFEQNFNYLPKDDRQEVLNIYAYIKTLAGNLDIIPSWCKYNKIVNDCKQSGLDFIVEPIRNGQLTAKDILSSFRKNIYKKFIESEITLSNKLSQFSGKNLEDKIDCFKGIVDEYERLTREQLFIKLADSIPRSDEEGKHNLEMVMLQRAEKSKMKGYTLRKLFEQIPTILKSACPCMLMSPNSVTQFLTAEVEPYDLVVFDEASQMPTCKAIGAIARAKNVIVVGDPKQLPPTSFFVSDYKDEENLQNEDLESILDDCLALGMPERHLLWHYRSKHESLIAFSNAMYYENKLLTFPSPNEMNSKVTLRYVEGIYERGGSKCNKKEADELIKEVVSRLKSPITQHQSIGIVTFNTAQRNYIEDLLNNVIIKNNLEEFAFKNEEPIFVKNLENVQGDERDIILFAVGYGPDSTGKLSLNFGPLNQGGGYRRLNVAVTRARDEMVIFSSITANMIDLSRTNSKGVKGLKAFLEYAEKGREMLAFNSNDVKEKQKGIGYYIAKDLENSGYRCEYDVGVSGFKIDVAVVDPKNKEHYILGIICDGDNSYSIKSVKDRIQMYEKTLKHLGWNIYKLWVENYFNNSKREIAKIKDYLKGLTLQKAPSKKNVKATLAKYKRVYKGVIVKPLAKTGADFVLDDMNDAQIITKARSIIEQEQPIEKEYLLAKLFTTYNISKTSKKAVAKMTNYVESLEDLKESYKGYEFYRNKSVSIDCFRAYNADKAKREVTQYHPYEIFACIKCALDINNSMTKEDLIKEVYNLLEVPRKTKFSQTYLEYCITMAVDLGKIIMAVDKTLTQ
ncbi:MAG: DUF4011 domain-containing protein [Clostridia bacterium]